MFLLFFMLCYCCYLAAVVVKRTRRTNKNTADVDVDSEEQLSVRAHTIIMTGDDDRWQGKRQQQKQMTLLLFFVCLPPLCFVLLLQIRRHGRTNERKKTRSIDRNWLMQREKDTTPTTQKTVHTQILLSTQRNRLNDDESTTTTRPMAANGEDSKRIKIILKLINTQLKSHLIQRGAKNKYNNNKKRKLPPIQSMYQRRGSHWQCISSPRFFSYTWICMLDIWGR